MTTPARPSRAQVCAITAAASLAAAANAQVIFRPLGSLPPDRLESTALSASADGSTIVGQCYTTTFSQVDAPYVPTAWTPERAPVQLESLPGYELTLPKAASADGSVLVGEAAVNLSEVTRTAVMWSDGKLSVLPGFTPDSSSCALQVSDDGAVILGWSSNGDAGRRACIWSDGQIYDLDPDYPNVVTLGGMTPDAVYVVGWRSAPAARTRAVRWNPVSGFQDLPIANGLPGSAATAISADGTYIVGAGQMTNGDWRAVRWVSAGAMENLGTLPGFMNSSAYDVSADGRIVVGSVTHYTPTEEAFIWIEGQGMQFMLDFLGDAVPPGWILKNCKWVSDNGRIFVGNGINPEGNSEAWVAYLAEKCPADFNGNGSLDTGDFAAFRNAYLADNPSADFNGNGALDVADFTAFRDAYLTGCP